MIESNRTRHDVAIVLVAALNDLNLLHEVLVRGGRVDLLLKSLPTAGDYFFRRPISDHHDGMLQTFNSESRGNSEQCLPSFSRVTDFTPKKFLATVKMLEAFSNHRQYNKKIALQPLMRHNLDRSHPARDLVPTLKASVSSIFGISFVLNFVFQFQ